MFFVCFAIPKQMREGACLKRGGYIYYYYHGVIIASLNT